MELTGFRFGRLLVLRKAPSGKRVPWVCQCDCGVVVVRAQYDLRRGDTTSCGCARRDATSKKNRTHGLTGTTTYKKWQGMHKRVRHPEHTGNACYVNATVCKRWKTFVSFLADMGECPNGYSLDRKNNAKGYAPSNCRWVPLAEQGRNTSRLRSVGDTYVSEAARRAGLDPDVVFDRLNKLGWDMHRALTTPKRKQRRSCNG